MHHSTTRSQGLLAALGATTLYVLVTVAVFVQLIPSEPHLTRRYIPFNPQTLSAEPPASDGRGELVPQVRNRAGAPVAENLHAAAGIDGPRWVERSLGVVEHRTSIGHRWLLREQLRGRAPPGGEPRRS
ncbi:MAG: hypothetical protein JWM90_174 [Thermoleophilia bacterium]|nr:hypothetical protein [Thermoleophilia bacterium]